MRRALAVLGVLTIATVVIIATPSAVRGGTPQVAPPCGEMGDPVALDAVADVEARLVGTWIRCDGATRMFWAHEGDDVGFEFTAEGRFHRVYEGADGSLIRAEGRLQEGGWVIDAVPGGTDASLGMTLSGSGFFPVGATFHDEPDAMRVTDGMDGTVITYVRWTGTAPEPGLPVGVGEGPCGQPTDPIVLESSAHVEELLAGTWTVCFGEPLGSGVIGAEFAADGIYRALVHAADGQVVPDDRSAVATWFVHPFDEPFDIHNGPQVDIVDAEGRTRILGPQFFSSPPFFAVFPAAGLISGTPAALESQPTTTVSEPTATIPATGVEAPWSAAAVAGLLVLVGAVTLGAARRPDRGR